MSPSASSWTVPALVLVSLMGCQAATRVHFVPLGARAMDTAEPLIKTVAPSESVFWVNADGRLCLALSEGPLSTPSGGSSGRDSFQLSLELGEPPASGTRQYPVDKRTLRAIAHQGPQHHRFASTFGVVAVAQDGGGGLSGRFRINTKRQAFSVFLGWAFDTEVLVLGEFRAELDEKRAQEIIAATEGGGLQRAAIQINPVPASAPSPVPSR